jgi:fibronectin type 3 domain-containing protein
VGARLLYEDDPPFHTSDGRPVRLDYAVTTETSTAQGQFSNLVTIVPLDVPVPPSALTATPKAEGVILAWQAPTTTVTGVEKPYIIGYNLFRVAQGQTSDELATPVNAAPVGQTTYTDVPPYGTFEYRVTAVSAAGPPRIESDPSAPVTATFKDLMPPPTPTGLTALVETNGVRLVWDAVEAPDLAGYKVYRTEGSGVPLTFTKPHILFTPQPILGTNFRDTTVELGIAYFYEVTAVDKSGNESAPAKTDWILVPKTP